MKNHWSFVVVERPRSIDSTIIYHVNTLRGCHDPSYIFTVTECNTTFTNYNYITKPRQTNVVDCAVYVLHYMHAVFKFVVKHRPDTLLEHMPSLTTGTFNVKKAAASRAKIRSMLTPNLK
eukprot:jgi/Phyca11/128146/e_gw1.74.233.1